MGLYLDSQVGAQECSGAYTRNFLTFVNTTAIACYQNIAAPGDFLPVCNSSRVYKRQKITSTVVMAKTGKLWTWLAPTGSIWFHSGAVMIPPSGFGAKLLASEILITDNSENSNPFQLKCLAQSSGLRYKSSEDGT